MQAAAPQPAIGISRRSFIAGGVALAAATSVIGGVVLRNQPSALARLAAAPGPRLSIGYVEGATTLAEAAGLPVVPAFAVPSGDAGLLGTLVRVRVHGLSPGLAEGDRPEVTGLALDALIPSPRDRTGEVLPFYAWNLRRAPAPQAASPATFAAAVEHEPTLGFRLGVARADADSDPQSGPVAVFTAGRERHQPKMREGLYLLGVQPGTWSEPSRLPAADDRRWPALLSVVMSITAGR